MRRFGPAFVAALALAAGFSARAADPPPSSGASSGSNAHGIADARRAQLDYMLNCQGCHRADGTGGADTAPPLAGRIGVFTRIPGGREYLVRVPGVATSPLDDAALAEMLNWTLWRFDGAHVGPGFAPYTPAEVAALRRSPLRTEASAVRAALLARAPVDRR